MMDLLGEKGSSLLLSVLPLRDQGFNVNKGEFRYALNLRYGWQMKNLLHQYKCGKAFSTDHSMTFPHGGLLIARHNEVRDIINRPVADRNVYRRGRGSMVKG